MNNPLELKTVYFSDRAGWRDWLSRHHDREPDGVWLVYYKKQSGKPSIEYNDSVEEALCFGWVDSLIRRLDEDRYARKFTPRKADSQWSGSNRARVRKLIEQGLMAEPGMKRVETARASGAWSTDSRPQVSDTISPAFERALSNSHAARMFFDTLTAAQRRHYVLWINQAKREATVIKRIKESVRLLEQGEKLGMK